MEYCLFPFSGGCNIYRFIYVTYENDPVAFLSVTCLTFFYNTFDYLVCKVYLSLSLRSLFSGQDRMQFFVLSIANEVLFPYSSLIHQSMSCHQCLTLKARFLGEISFLVSLWLLSSSKESLVHNNSRYEIKSNIYRFLIHLV